LPFPTINLVRGQVSCSPSGTGFVSCTVRNVMIASILPGRRDEDTNDENTKRVISSSARVNIQR
jgi:hypothetical protein